VDSAYNRVISALHAHGSKVIESGNQVANAQCPAHDDSNPSLSITGIPGKTLICCHAGCNTVDILAALGLGMADLYDERSATYPYDDGRVIQRVYGKDGKKRFRQTGAGPTSVLYHLEQLRAAGPDRHIFLVEGEEDVRAIEAAGGIATTAPQGADSFHKVDASPLAGRTVVCVVDKDAAGDKWAIQVAAKLEGVAKAYRFARAKEGKDASDHIAAGHGLNAFADYQLPAVDAGPAQRLLQGGSFVLDVPDVAPAVWGDGKDVIWAQGEALMICGPSGVGKTTLALQLLRARISLQYKVLGYSVAQTGGRVLYLVMDRPAQFQRAARRVFTEDERGVLNDRLVVWKGPPPKDLALHPGLLIELCELANADTVFIDSVKDAAVGIAKDEVGAGYNRARQTALAEGIEVIELHHMRKSSADNKRPNSLDDIYGSTWLTAGAGSVVLLWGEAGDPVVEWRHLKQPESEVGPFKVTHDHDTGVSEVEANVDLKAMIIRTGVRGLTAFDYAAQLFAVSKPSDAQKKKAMRLLNRKVTEGFLSRIDGASGGDASHYFLRQL
jgi:AAA domain